LAIGMAAYVTVYVKHTTQHLKNRRKSVWKLLRVMKMMTDATHMKAKLLLGNLLCQHMPLVSPMLLCSI